jgi:hypothetical protein
MKAVPLIADFNENSIVPFALRLGNCKNKYCPEFNITE